MSHETEIRTKVSKAYADAIEGKGGCCGTARAGNAAPSFGCGNPLAFAEVRPGETVLDLGSGAGHDLLFAADAVGPGGRVIGVDMTDAMLEAARRFTAGRSNVELRKGLIETLPVEDASVDWVISNCVINLSPEKARVFREIRRVLKPGGRFSISDIVARDLPASLLENDFAYSSCIAGAIPEEAYVAGLRAAGLEDVAVAERHPYTAEELCGLARRDFGTTLDLEAAGTLDVASVRIIGKRPRP